MNTYTKLLRNRPNYLEKVHNNIVPIYIANFKQYVSPQIIIILYFMSQQKIYTKRKIAYKKQNLEHKCALLESCKTVRRWQRSILLFKGGHCVGDW